MRKIVIISLLLSSWPACAAPISRPAPIVALSRALLRNRLITHLDSPKAASGELIVVLNKLRAADSALRKAILSDPEILRALSARVPRLLKEAKTSSELAAVQEAHYELRLLYQELKTDVPQIESGRLLIAREHSMEALQNSVNTSATETVGEILKGTTHPLGTDTVDDSSRMNNTKVAAVLKPKTTQDIMQAIALAEKLGVPLSVSGARHSQGGLIVSEGSVHINLLDFDKLMLDADRKILTAQSGALWGDAQMRLLDPAGLSLDVTQVPNYFGIGATASVNAHGHNIDAGPVASTIDSMHIIGPDRRMRNASALENPELFRLALGGFGLFGVIRDVTLRVRPNEMYRQSFHIVDYRDFPAYHAKMAEEGSTARYGHNLYSLAPGSFLEKILVIRYDKIDGNPLLPLVRKSLRSEIELAINQALTRLTVSSDLGKAAAWHLLTNILIHFADTVQTRNRVMNEPFTHFSTGKNDEAQILQEYFIPRGRVVAFMDDARRILKEDPINLMMVAQRAVKKDPISFMSYAPQDVFGVVFISNHKATEPEFARLAKTTRRLTAAALKQRGRFYRIYRPDPTREQVVEAYDNLDEFFAKQRQYDPRGRFANKWSQNYAQPAAPAPASEARDLSAEFTRLWRGAENPLSPRHIDELREHKIIFADGLLADLFLKFGKYFNDQMDWLTKLRVSNMRAATNTQAAAKRNVAELAREIEQSDRDVILLSHSHGGIDVLELLLERPDLRRKVRGWIAIQAPFAGSPMSDWYQRHHVFRRLANLLLRSLGGSLESLTEMETPYREQWIEKHAAELAQLAKEVPILSVATWKDPVPGKRWDSVLAYRRNWMLRKGIKSDGFVPADSAVLPYADFVKIEGLSHADPVMPDLPHPFDRVAFTAVTLRMLLDLPRKP